jgi:hypothetical protein
MNRSNIGRGFAAFVAMILVDPSLRAEDKPSATPTTRPPRVVESEDAISIHIGDRPVLQYNKTNTPLPAGIEPVYARSGYIHPIYSPSGAVVTGDYAADHPHQNGLFNAWVDTTFRGHHVDFWNKKKGLGRVSHEKVLSTLHHDDRAEFSVQLIHQDISQADVTVTVLREKWHVIVYPQTKAGYIIDIISTQTCATSDPLIVNEYHYGGMAIRGCDPWYSDTSAAAVKAYTKELKSNPDAEPPSIEVMNHDFLTSQSKSRFDGNHSRPNWVDLHGTVDGKMAGIAILNHNQNFRSPQPVRLNPSKPYFCFAPCVLGTFEIKPGDSYVAKYRLVIHDGPPALQELDKCWDQYNAETP